MVADPTLQIADGLEHQLDPRIITVQRIVGWIFTGFAAGASLIFVLILWLANDWPWWALPPLLLVWSVAIGALAWQTQRWPAIAYRFAFYRVDELGIEIRRGVYWREVVNVPRSRVQHTDVSQGPLERKYGLATLVIFTAGTEHARVSLEGLEHSTALEIRQHLLPAEKTDAV